MSEAGTATLTRPKPVERPWFTESRSRGLNFFELLVVIALLGVLAAIVVSSVGHVVRDSWVTACNQNANTIDVAAAAYRVENPGMVPTEALLMGSGGPGDRGAPFVQSWPQSARYRISLEPRLSTAGGHAVRGVPAAGDVLVTVGGRTLNATASTARACEHA